MITTPQPDGTYPAPKHGWTCFHCGETFKKPGAARDHFGPTPDWSPLCIERKTVANCDLLDRARSAEKYSLECQKSRDEANEEAEALACELSALRNRFPGARTVYDAWCQFHSMEGRALTAEAILNVIGQDSPGVVSSAREKVCGPGLYVSPTLKAIVVDKSWLLELVATVHKSDLAMGDRLQRISSSIEMFLIRAVERPLAGAQPSPDELAEQFRRAVAGPQSNGRNADSQPSHDVAVGQDAGK
jgi:hypothetical protein